MLKPLPLLLFPLILSILFPVMTMAQTTDSITKPSPPKSYAPPIGKLIRSDTLRENHDSTSVFFFYNDLEKFGDLNLHANDTALEGFENYDMLYQQDKFFATLGNTGQAYRSLQPFKTGIKSGFDYGLHSLDLYLYKNDSVKYYDVYKTFSELTYVQGAKKEQNFRATFSRNLYRTLNLGFDFHVMSSPGAYSRQKTNHINFVLTTQYFSKNRRYGVIANYTVNRLRNYENGGIRYDSLFEQNLETNRLLIPVNLTDAQNRVKESGFYMKHYFDLSPHSTQKKDSAQYRERSIDLGRLAYSFEYNRQIQHFIDALPDSGFFPPPALDSLQTSDSVTLRKIINDLTWSNPGFRPDKKPRILRIEAGLRQQYSEVSLNGQKHFFLQFIPHGEIDFRPFQSLRLNAEADYVLGDYNEGDFSLAAQLISILGKEKRNAGTVTLSALYRFMQPGWFYTHYLGNSFAWDTSWNKTGYIEGGFRYAYKFFETGFTMSRVSNYVYLDTASQPRQFSDEFGHLTLYFNTHLKAGRFYLRSKLLYQTVQGTTVIKLPVFMGSLSGYYSQPLFKEAALFQPGLSFYYNTSYYADSYNPALRSYYLQNKRETGNYLFMDVFINLKIQRARFFFTYSHFNAGWMGYEYYSTPGYPMPDAAFKFGITWRFHD